MGGDAGFAEERTFARRDDAAQDLAAAAAGVVVADGDVHRQQALNVMSGVRFFHAQARLRDDADAAPWGIDGLVDFGERAARGGAARRLHDALVFILDARLAFRRLLQEAHERAQDGHGREAGHDAGRMKFVRDELEDVEPSDDRDMARQQEAVDADFRVREERPQRWRHELLRREQVDVLEPRLLGREHERGGRRSRRLEADSEEDDFLGGVFASDGQRVERRIDDADVGALGLCLGKARLGARHFQHVAERREDDVVTVGVGDGLVHVVVGRDADGTARAADERDVLWQQLADARAENRDGVRTADLHIAERPPDFHREAPNLGDKRLRGLAFFLSRELAVCGRCLRGGRHESASTVRGAPFISSSSAYVSSASFSSTICMAKPACTST